MQEAVVGRRICIWGVTGSGKTTLSRRLGEALRLPVIELDAIRHARGWDSTDWPEFRAILAQRFAEYSEGWVLEGSYSPIYDAYLPHIDTMIWLNLPWRTSFVQLLGRTLSRAWSKEPLYNPDGPTESWRLTFFSPRSILWWSIRMHRPTQRRRRESIASLPPEVRVYELHSRREVEAFVAAVERVAGAAHEP